jgi:hypothetical protein
MPRFANVVSSLALFMGLGGTAVAAVSLERDSVGSREIRTDAVEAPEIAADAVRGSEIRDGSIRVGDLSTGARDVLDTRLRVAQKEFAEIEVCPGDDPTGCAVLISRTLAPGNWLVRAEFLASGPDGTASSEQNHCGLVAADAPPGERLLTSARIPDLGSVVSGEHIALSGVITGVTDTIPVTLRCSLAQGQEMDVEDMTLTATEVGAVTGP